MLEVEPSDVRTCFVVLSQPLSATSRPTEGDHSLGRFIACRDGFYDPAIFAPGRSLTIVGRVTGNETRTVGEFKYRYPVLEAEVIYLWPQPQDSEWILIDPFWPSYRPWPWGGYYRPYPAPRRSRAQAPAAN